jgi:hypothetical protein
VSGKVSTETAVTVEMESSSHKEGKAWSYRLSLWAEGLCNLEDRACLQAKVLCSDGSLLSLLKLGLSSLLFALNCTDKIVLAS